MRHAIEQRAGIDAVDIYGLSEVMGPGVANECVETKDGPTIWEDHFYPEIIDPDTGEVLPDGEEGELVFTSLTKEALPIIRYRTRDLTRLLPGTARTMRRMQKITGRSDDMMIIRGVNVFPTQIEELILKRPSSRPTTSACSRARGPGQPEGGRGDGARPGPLGIEARAAAKLLQHEIKIYGQQRRDRAQARGRHRAQRGQGAAGGGFAQEVISRRGVFHHERGHRRARATDIEGLHALDALDLAGAGLAGHLARHIQQHARAGGAHG
jgi:phenylacetate-CoA ligase